MMFSVNASGNQEFGDETLIHFRGLENTRQTLSLGSSKLSFVLIGALRGS